MDAFGSSVQSEPSSCPVLVRATQQPLNDAKEFFYYSVPILLDNENDFEEISFFLYLTPQIVKGEQNNSTS